MKAALYFRYGPPEVIQIREVEKPVPSSKQLLIHVRASTVNRTDAGFRSAVYFISRFWSGLMRPKRPILGCEFAGVIEEVGNEVALLKKGDRVFGYNDSRFGGHAEYLCTDAESVELIPENLNFTQAAPLTEGAHYALNNIRASKIKAGQHAMVYGASGAIGSAAVQLLKFFGVQVTAVCGSHQVTLIKSLGADVVVDYQTEDFTQIKTKFDFIFDAVGKSSFGQCKHLLNKKGIYISTELGKRSENVFLALLTPLLGGKKVLFPIPVITKQDLTFLKELAEKGHFKPLIDRQYKLEEIVEAYKYVETGQKTGNVVLEISAGANSA